MVDLALDIMVVVHHAKDFKVEGEQSRLPVVSTMNGLNMLTLSTTLIMCLYLILFRYLWRR